MDGAMRFSRRQFLGSIAAIASARAALAAVGEKPGSLGICTFSCHRAWTALKAQSAKVPFSDVTTFYDYVRKIGADGVQTSVTMLDEAAARQFGQHVEESGGYYEGDVGLPRKETELDRFERDVTVTKAAGATVARTVLLGSRRYETFKTLEEFEAFRAAAPKRLRMVEPILRKHGLKLSVENHKDLLAADLAGLMRGIDSEWIGVNVDTGNNIALLEDPYEVVETLAPFALSVHFKDMAVRPDEKGFRLSEVPVGTGFLDVARIAATLKKANPGIRLSLEMGTRDPLLVPCLTDAYYVTFPERRETHLEGAMTRVKANPPKEAPPVVSGKPMERQVAEEESNNVASLRWMHGHLGG
jgi:sugar phosphate isomerase/epimerase